MKILNLLLLFFLFSCQSKQQTKPELDYVKMEIFPGALPPSTINLDLKNKLIVFNNHKYLNFINENGEADFDLIKRDVEFLYLELIDEEIDIINSSFNQKFLDSIISNNNKSITNPDDYFGIINDGISVKFDIVQNINVFSSDNYLILNDNELLILDKLFKIIRKHTKSEENKKHLEYISSEK